MSNTKGTVNRARVAQKPVDGDEDFNPDNSSSVLNTVLNTMNNYSD